MIESLLTTNNRACMAGSAMKALLMERVETIPFSGCWLWAGKVDGRGYGQVYLGGGRKRPVLGRVHRLMFEAEFGEIPEGMYVCHRCDVPSCINPDHLFVGSHRDNMQDAARKGRIAKGELSGKAKLTSDQVAEIRSRHAEGGVTQKILGKEYGVAPRTISNIVNYRRWVS